MIGLDTNVLVRYIMQDDAKQSARASDVIESLTEADPGHVPLVVMIELSWVLLSCYGLTRAQLAQALEALLRTREIRLEQAETVWKALRVYAGSGADFADCLIERSAASAGCECTVSFDRNAAKHAGMELLA